MKYSRQKKYDRSEKQLFKPQKLLECGQKPLYQYIHDIN
jgi:hypothetical protein